MTFDEQEPDTMKDGHSVRIRGHRWEKVEKQAWKLMQQSKTLIKPTDIVDACVWLYIDRITLDDLENAKKTQTPEE